VRSRAAEVFEPFDDGSPVATIAPRVVDENKGGTSCLLLSVVEVAKLVMECEADGLDLSEVPLFVTRRRSVVFTNPQKGDVGEAVDGRKKT
jgi:hypothetical protein